MHIFRSAARLIGQLGFGFLALGALSQPLRSGLAPQLSTPPAASVAPVTGVATTQAAQDWSFQIDEPTLTQDLNAWAAGQPLFQTPVGQARLQDLTVRLRNDQLALRGTAEAGWVRAPVDVAASASVQMGRVQVQVREAHINGVDVPEVARREFAQQLQDQLDQTVAVNHAVVRSVRVADGKLVVSGTRQ